MGEIVYFKKKLVVIVYKFFFAVLDVNILPEKEKAFTQNQWKPSNINFLSMEVYKSPASWYEVFSSLLKRSNDYKGAMPMLTDLNLSTYLILFATGLCAGFVDSIAGGGGLIALPVLFSIGLPPQTALGTNKLQGSFGTLAASCNYIRKGVVKFNENLSGILFTLIGAALGAWAIQLMRAGFIERLIPGLLLFVFLYTLFMKNLDTGTGNPRMPNLPFYLLFGLGLGFYDGFFGPGTGSFWTAALLIVMGMDMKKASGITRIMNFTSNIVALSVFVMGGNVMYSVGLCMAAGQVIGARAGSSLAIRKGAKFIRPVFLTVVFLTILRLAWKTYF